MTERSVTLSINGSAVELRAPDGATLLDVLHARLGMRATRRGCGEEKCGACTVLVDGRTDFACTRLVATLAGHEIETVEGLALDEPVIAALINWQAAQCGFCLPGIVMSARALLAENPAPDRAAVLAALEPHLCRCGAHQRIVAAILSVAAA